MTQDELDTLARGECPNDGHHIFPKFGPICQCGQIDTRNDPPRIICPTCGGTGEVEIDSLAIQLV